MNDNIIQFPIRNHSKGEHQSIPIMFNSASQKALEERIAAESLSATDIVNRAVQVYGCVQTLISHLDRYDRMSGVLTEPSGASFRITVQKVSD